MELKNKWIQTQAYIWNPNFKSRHIFQDFSNPEKLNSNQPLHKSQSQDPRQAATHGPTNPGPPTAPRPHADVHCDNPKSQIDHPQNPNHNLHVMLLKT